MIPSAHAYAISKYEGEMEVWRGIAEGLDAVIVNPSVIIGKNAGFEGSGAIFKLVKDGLSFYTRGATGIVDVEDVAKSMILLMDSEISCRTIYTFLQKITIIKQFFAKLQMVLELKHQQKKPNPGCWVLPGEQLNWHHYLPAKRQH